MNEKQNQQYCAIMKHWPPLGWRCPFCGGIHAFPQINRAPLGHKNSVDLICIASQKEPMHAISMLQLWCDEGLSNVWQLNYSAHFSKKDYKSYGTKYWAEWKVPDFVSNEIWLVGKLGKSLPIRGARYSPNHILVFGLVLDDDSMKDILACNPTIITAEQVDKLYGSRNRFDKNHNLYYGHEKPLLPRSYFRSTPFLDDFLMAKHEIGAILDSDETIDTA